jgi:tetratricopeptide (TPR) repeat protein
VRNDRRAVHEHMESLLDSPFARKSANGHLAAVAQAEGDEAQARIYQQRAARLPSDLDWPDPFLHEMNAHEVGRRNRILEAERLEGRGQLREAVAILRQIATDAPDIRSYVTLGLGLGKLGAYDEAEQVLHAALRIDAGNSQANYALGTVLLMNGEQHLGTPEDREPAHELFRKAIAAQDRVLAVQPDHGMAHLMRGRALQRLGRADAAIQALREAALCRPDLADAHRYLGEALAEAGQLSEGLTHLEDAVRLAGPNDPAPRQALERWRAKAKSPS